MQPLALAIAGRAKANGHRHGRLCPTGDTAASVHDGSQGLCNCRCQVDFGIDGFVYLSHQGSAQTQGRAGGVGHLARRARQGGMEVAHVVAAYEVQTQRYLLHTSIYGEDAFVALVQDDIRCLVKGFEDTLAPRKQGGLSALAGVVRRQVLVAAHHNDTSIARDDLYTAPDVVLHARPRPRGLGGRRRARRRHSWRAVPYSHTICPL